MTHSSFSYSATPPQGPFGSGAREETQMPNASTRSVPTPGLTSPLPSALSDPVDQTTERTRGAVWRGTTALRPLTPNLLAPQHSARLDSTSTPLSSSRKPTPQSTIPTPTRVSGRNKSMLSSRLQRHSHSNTTAGLSPSSFHLPLHPQQQSSGLHKPHRVPSTVHSPSSSLSSSWALTETNKTPAQQQQLQAQRYGCSLENMPFCPPSPRLSFTASPMHSAAQVQDNQTMSQQCGGPPVRGGVSVSSAAFCHGSFATTTSSSSTTLLPGFGEGDAFSPTGGPPAPSAGEGESSEALLPDSGDGGGAGGPALTNDPVGFACVPSSCFNASFPSSVFPPTSSNGLVGVMSLPSGSLSGPVSQPSLLPISGGAVHRTTSPPPQRRHTDESSLTSLSSGPVHLSRGANSPCPLDPFTLTHPPPQSQYPVSGAGTAAGWRESHTPPTVGAGRGGAGRHPQSAPMTPGGLPPTPTLSSHTRAYHRQSLTGSNFSSAARASRTRRRDTFHEDELFEDEDSGCVRSRPRTETPTPSLREVTSAGSVGRCVPLRGPFDSFAEDDDESVLHNVAAQGSSAYPPPTPTNTNAVTTSASAAGRKQRTEGWSGGHSERFPAIEGVHRPPSLHATAMMGSPHSGAEEDDGSLFLLGESGTSEFNLDATQLSFHRTAPSTFRLGGPQRGQHPPSLQQQQQDDQRVEPSRTVPSHPPLSGLLDEEEELLLLNATHNGRVFPEPDPVLSNSTGSPMPHRRGRSNEEEEASTSPVPPLLMGCTRHVWGGTRQQHSDQEDELENDPQHEGSMLPHQLPPQQQQVLVEGCSTTGSPSKHHRPVSPPPLSPTSLPHVLFATPAAAKSPVPQPPSPPPQQQVATAGAGEGTISSFSLLLQQINSGTRGGTCSLSSTTPSLQTPQAQHRRERTGATLAVSTSSMASCGEEGSISQMGSQSQPSPAHFVGVSTLTLPSPYPHSSRVNHYPYTPSPSQTSQQMLQQRLENVPSDDEARTPPHRPREEEPPFSVNGACRSPSGLLCKEEDTTNRTIPLFFDPCASTPGQESHATSPPPLMPTRSPPSPSPPSTVVSPSLCPAESRSQGYRGNPPFPGSPVLQAMRPHQQQQSHHHHHSDVSSSGGHHSTPYSLSAGGGAPFLTESGDAPAQGSSWTTLASCRPYRRRNVSPSVARNFNAAPPATSTPSSAPPLPYQRNTVVSKESGGATSQHPPPHSSTDPNSHQDAGATAVSLECRGGAEEHLYGATGEGSCPCRASPLEEAVGGRPYDESEDENEEVLLPLRGSSPLVSRVGDGETLPGSLLPSGPEGQQAATLARRVYEATADEPEIDQLFYLRQEEALMQSADAESQILLQEQEQLSRLVVHSQCSADTERWLRQQQQPHQFSYLTTGMPLHQQRALRRSSDFHPEQQQHCCASLDGLPSQPGASAVTATPPLALNPSPTSPHGLLMHSSRSTPASQAVVPASLFLTETALMEEERSRCRGGGGVSRTATQLSEDWV